MVGNGKSLVPKQFHSTNIVERFVVGNGKPLAQNSSTQLTLESVLGGGTKTLAGAIVCYHAPQIGGIKLTDGSLTNATLKKTLREVLEWC